MNIRVAMGVMRVLVDAWQKSLSLFELRELSVMLLVTLKTAGRATWLTTKYFGWWLVVAICYFDLYFDGVGVFSRFWEYGRPLIYSSGLMPRVYLGLLALLAYVIVLSVRASIEVKRFWYYLSYFVRFFIFFTFFVALPQWFLLPVFWFAVFFFFDGPYSLIGIGRSLLNGVVLCAAYLPFILGVGSLHGVLFYLYQYVWSKGYINEQNLSVYFVKFFISIIIYILFVSMLHTLYVKVKHGNQKLFWKNSVKGKKRTVRRAMTRKMAARKAPKSRS